MPSVEESYSQVVPSLLLSTTRQQSSVPLVSDEKSPRKGASPSWHSVWNGTVEP